MSAWGRTVSRSGCCDEAILARSAALLVPSMQDCSNCFSTSFQCFLLERDKEHELCENLHGKVQGSMVFAGMMLD